MSSSNGHPIGVARTQGELAKAFAVSTRTIQRWIERGMPVRPDGTYEIAACARWEYRANYEKYVAIGSGLELKNGTNSEIVSWAQRAHRADAMRKEHLLEVAKAEHMKVSDVEAMLVARIVVMRAGLLRLSRAVASRCAQGSERRIRQEIDERIHDLLAKYANGEGTDTGGPKVLPHPGT